VGSQTGTGCSTFWSLLNNNATANSEDFHYFTSLRVLKNFDKNETPH
jgi:hypothetical protein